MKVVIIGSGNVATVLGKKIANAKHEIIQVAGRNIEKVASLASLLKSTYTANLLEINSYADIYIIAISDISIISIVKQLQLKDKVVVHTAAAVSKDVLQISSKNYGVLYPLQTFKEELVRIPEIPLLIDANNDETKEFLFDFSASWADSVTVVTEEERLKIHLAAVFLNNFTNHIFAVAEDYCISNQLDFNLLRPLIKETIVRAEAFPASSVQTGPAIRNDWVTIKKHQKLLESAPETLTLYNALTESIIAFYKKNKT